ncbi:MAG: hypothetical protein PVF68_05765 [Acidobacteriota bacterium]|jgi:hypothetical protein
MEGLFLFFLIPVAALIGWAVHQYRKKVDAAWGAAAASLDLEHSSGGTFGKRQISGELDGLRVLVDRHVRRAGNNSKAFTRYRIDFPRPLGIGLRLKREGMLFGFARMLGAQDIQVGDAAFDADVVVKGSDPRRVIEFLTPARRLRILRLLNALAGCEINDTGIVWSCPGMETDPGRLAGHLRRLVRVASHLSRPAEAGDRLGAAVDAIREGRTEEALEAVRRDPAQRDPDAGLVEGQILYSGGRYQEAAEAFRAADAAGEGDEELAGWSARAEGKLATPDPGPAPTAAPEEPTSPGPPPAGPASDPGPVCRDLFEAGVLSLEAARRFEERYRGLRVRWTGAFRRAERYAFDLVFGDRPGTRLVVDLLELEGGVLARRVRASVQLPPDAVEHLRLRPGESIAFEGALAACDAFTRVLFVREGRVVEAEGPGAGATG